VAVLWQHDWEEPIGRATGFKDSPSQLEFTARISAHDDIPTARKALALLREGVVDEISVGFEWGTWHEEGTDDGLTIVHTKARLREFSVVTFGALGRAARVQSVAAEGIAVEVYRRRLAGLTG
jgi:HK97 family phage prohead protease